MVYFYSGGQAESTVFFWKTCDFCDYLFLLSKSQHMLSTTKRCFFPWLSSAVFDMLVQSIFDCANSVLLSAAEINGGEQWSRPKLGEVKTT